MKVHRALYVGQHHLHLDDAVSCKEDHHRNHILKNTNTQYMYLNLRHDFLIETFCA